MHNNTDELFGFYYIFDHTTFSHENLYLYLYLFLRSQIFSSSKLGLQAGKHPDSFIVEPCC